MAEDANAPAVRPEARDMIGPEALPRSNGELVFAAPWEGRVLGATLGLVERLDLPWDAFRQHLIAAIADDPDRPYYESWVVALEALVVELGIGDPADLDRRTSTEPQPSPDHA